jgi:hypothetical protein
MRNKDMYKTPTYSSWDGMKQRCLNPNNVRFKDYGGRGIKVCKSWLSFDNFFEDMGIRPKNLTIERINNNGNYEPGNCEWTTYTEQARNQRMRKTNTSGTTGVCFHRLGSNWTASITVGGKQIHLGSFKLKAEAITARKAAEEKYFNKKFLLDRRIPERLSIGGIDFDVDYPHQFIETDELAGRIMFDLGKIFISKKSANGQPTTNNHDFRVFLHEATHCILKQYCNGLFDKEIEEELTDGIANGFAQMLTDTYYLTVKPENKRTKE